MIPLQLQNPEFRFVLIKEKEKAPFELNWQETRNYPFDAPQLKNHKGNYGVLCGKGHLCVIDGDKEELWKKVEAILPETFTVKTGRGGRHFYYICKDLKKGIRLTSEKQGDIGDVQFEKKQVVAPGSTHPNGNKYEVYKNVPIAEITEAEIKMCVSEWMKKDEKPQIHKTKYDDDLDIMDVVNVSKLKRHGNEYFGEHPVHGSDTGSNFWINTSKNCWHCFRHGTGGGALSLIAIQEGIIDCSDAGVGCLKGNTFKKVLKIAEEQYGLKIKKPEITKDFETAIKSFVNKIDMAKQFIKIQPIYYTKEKIWWVWNSERYCWEMKDDVDVLNMVYFTVQGVNVINSTERTEIINALKQVGRHKAPKPTKESWIQFKNKIIDIETGEEFEVTPEYFATNPIEWEIGESEETPIMDKLISEWVGSEWLQTIYEIIAYSISPTYFIHRIFCYVGSGANGKSTLLRMQEKFLGNRNYCSTELDTLMKGRFETAKLYKKLACFMGETNFGTISKTSMLKRLSGQDTIGYEFKGKDGFDDKNTAKLFIATNTLPQSLDTTDGFYRRWLTIKFPNKFSGEKDILSEIPEQEYHNLATKCVRLLKKLRKCPEFAKEGTIEVRKERYEAHSNPIAKFIEDNYKRNINGQIPFFEFYDRFTNYLELHGHRRLTKKEVSKQLEMSGFDTEAKHVTRPDGSNTKWVYVMGLSENGTDGTDGTLSELNFHEGISNVSTASIDSINSKVDLILASDFVLIDGELPKRDCSICKKFGEVVAQKNDDGIVKFICESCFNKQFPD